MNKMIIIFRKQQPHTKAARQWHSVLWQNNNLRSLRTYQQNKPPSQTCSQWMALLEEQFAVLLVYDATTFIQYNKYPKEGNLPFYCHNFFFKVQGVL